MHPENPNETVFYALCNFLRNEPMGKGWQLSKFCWLDGQVQSQLKTSWVSPQTSPKVKHGKVKFKFKLNKISFIQYFKKSFFGNYSKFSIGGGERREDKSFFFKITMLFSCALRFILHVKTLCFTHHYFISSLFARQLAIEETSHKALE